MAAGTSTSASLIQSVKAADTDAWQRLADLYGPVVYAWCRQAGLTQVDTADVAQNVFLAVFKNDTDAVWVDHVDVQCVLNRVG